MSISTYALASSDIQANKIITALKKAGFRGADISVLFPDHRKPHVSAQGKDSKVPDGTIAGGVSGGVIGGALGWMIGIGLLVIPGVGPFVAAGPIMALLSGAAVGAAAGSLTGALIRAGIPDFEAKRYENKIRDGRILISVHGQNNDWTSKAKQIFKDTGADDISSANQASDQNSIVTPVPMTTTHVAEK